MLQSIVLPDKVVLPDGPVPPLLAPIVAAARERTSLADALVAVVRTLGFDSFTYGTGSVPTPTAESRSYVWTNMPLEWVRIYDERSYLETDPRVSEAIAHAAPMAWDRYSFGDARRRREFFDAAAAYGICSGVAVGLRDPARALSGFYLNSPRPRLDAPALAHYAEIQGDVLLLAYFVHAVLTTNVVDRNLRPPSAGASLSPRELECLRLVAKGESSKSIATRLGGIGDRTVDYHIANALSKLECANRHQAVAKAVARGLVAP
jgi:DNA-binding CsgD family transcriptional regulator